MQQGMNDVEMGQRRALGPPRGSGSVKDRGHGLFVDVAHRRGSRREQRRERITARRVALEGHHGRQIGQRRARWNPVGQRRFHRQQLGPRMADHVFQFRRLQPVAQRHADRAQPRAGQHDVYEFDAVAGIERDAVAKTDAI